MKKMRILKKCISVCAMSALLICGMSACQGADQEQTSYMGSITAIEGKEITVTVMGGGGQFPGGMFGSKMLGGQMPEGNMPNMELPENFEQGEFNPENMFSGETMTIKVTGKTEITINGESGKAADLQVGDFIQFTMSGEKVTAINVGMSRQGMM